MKLLIFPVIVLPSCLWLESLFGLDDCNRVLFHCMEKLPDFIPVDCPVSIFNCKSADFWIQCGELMEPVSNWDGAVGEELVGPRRFPVCTVDGIRPPAWVSDNVHTL